MKWLAALCGAWAVTAHAQALPAQPLPAQPLPAQPLPAQPLPAQPPSVSLAYPAISPVAPPADRNVAIVMDPSSRLSAPVTIAGKPWNFLIDTASTRSVIASEVSDSLALVKGDALRILNIGGMDTVPSVIIPDLHFSDFVIRDVHAPALLRQNLGGDGLLGLDVLRNSRVSIDFRHDATLTIASSARRPPRVDRDTIVVVARSRMGELVITRADIEGHSVTVIIDTGSQETIGNPALARMLHGNSARVMLAPITLVSVTGRTMVADYATVGSLQIGGITIRNIPMAFGDVATFRQFGLTKRPAILLGMETLRLFATVTIDFPRREISFRLRDGQSGHEPAWPTLGMN